MTPAEDLQLREALTAYIWSQQFGQVDPVACEDGVSTMLYGFDHRGCEPDRTRLLGALPEGLSAEDLRK